MARIQANAGGGKRGYPSARAAGAGAPGRPATSSRTPPAPLPLFGLGGSRLEELERRSRSISDPVEKLRFLRRSLERCESVDEKVQAVPGAPLRWLARRLTGVDELRPLFSGNPNGALAEPRRSRTPLPRRARHTLNVAALLLVAAGGLALAAYPRSHPAPSAPTPERALPGPGEPTLPLADSGGLAPRPLAPERIWLVDSGKGFELYSNGLRIDTSFAVPGEPRRYRLFDVERGIEPGIHERPVGIVFHTSESDIWPLEESFNGKLRDSSQNLLHYLRKNKVYHYLIDRFGQVFRVVEERDRANHAGNSVWSAGRLVYLNLNGSTIGVSFETRWEGGRALPITRAQFEAGRSLSDYLRSKWSIAPELCVTHGLTSVNPKKHLIGHHLDWARGFPFAAFGLPDQYTREAPAVALFGFGYDERFLAVMGEPWPGVGGAEQAIEQEAQGEGRPLAQLRREKTGLYDQWFAEQAADPEMAGKTDAQAQEPRRNASGG